ncbi:MAG: amino acid permease [Bacteroidales bacterium]|jgi:amino acid transporter|nr:amino acid permease [Bacteroidales bacterium]
MSDIKEKKKFGTAPVFFTAISTILGAVLFLRFGFAVGTLGFFGVFILIIIGHLVTIPTALALSEIATNKRVEGGGEYFVISRSFGLNIGSTIGITLYLAQAISIAFYIIAFTESFSFFFDFIYSTFGFNMPRQFISIPSMILLALLIIKKGANMGLKALYIICGILFLSLLLFFLGSPKVPEFTAETATFNNLGLKNFDKFFIIFAICFPAFTGMTAGVGLSGDLKNPGKSIPIGTIAATIIGMIIYICVALKLSLSASTADLLNNQLVIGQIAIGGAFVVPLGLAAATFSSALGSVLVAPRTLQALSKDKIFPYEKINNFFIKEREKDGEPINASIFTCALAFIFVCIGDIDAVAQIISMFFLLTYGSLSLISFLHHFGSSPSYRPVFKSRWWISLIGFVVSVWVMFRINMFYASTAFIVLILIYIYVNSYHKDRRGLESIFINAVSQLNRNLRLFFQKRNNNKIFSDWRPSVICVSDSTFLRNNALRLLNWISYKYGFSTYLHEVVGKYSKENFEKAKFEKQQIMTIIEEKSSIFIDIIISPSRTTSLSQAIQIPGVSGLENNMVLFEFSKSENDELDDILKNYKIVKSGNFDFMFLASSSKAMLFKGGIHIWINAVDENNINLMIMLSFIISTHPDWKKSNIKVFVVTNNDEHLDFIDNFKNLIHTGRIPIMIQNVEFIKNTTNEEYKKIINTYSTLAGLTFVGINDELIQNHGKELFTGYDDIGDVLFVSGNNSISIE